MDPQSGLVGRGFALQRIADAFDHAAAGNPNLVFVSGDEGVGKTALVDAFVRTLDEDRILLARGACSEDFGGTEPYLPVLTALGKLARGRHRSTTDLMLRECAPTWRVQLPWLLGPDEHSALERSVHGTTATRMQREGIDLLERLSAALPLVVILDDLHWADQATLDFLCALADHLQPAVAEPAQAARPSQTAQAAQAGQAMTTGRPSPCADPARLLIVATLRRTDVKSMRTLLRHDGTTAISLNAFDLSATEKYVAGRGVGTQANGKEMARRLRDCTEGSPLFLRLAVDQVARGLALPACMSDAVRTELDLLDVDVRAVVELASLVGDPFSAATLATGLDRDVDDVERLLRRAARDGSLIERLCPLDEHADPQTHTATDFSFVHAAYARSVRGQIAPQSYVDGHLALARSLETATGWSLRELAGRLAVHFARGGDDVRSIDYCVKAAENAEHRFAYREAAQHLTVALGRLEHLPKGADRAQRDAALSIRLGSMLVLSNGCSDPDIEVAFRRAASRSQSLGESRGQFAANVGLAINALSRARFDLSVEYTRVLLELAQHSMSQMATPAGLYAGYTATSLGRLEQAHEVLSTALTHDGRTSMSAHYNHRRMVRSQLAIVLSLMGRLEEAREMVDGALEAGRSDGRPGDLAHAALCATDAAILRRDRDSGAETAALALAVTLENGFEAFAPLARFYAAWHAGDGVISADIPEMEAALKARRAHGDRWNESMLLGLLAEALLAGGNVGGARRRLVEAGRFIDETGEAHYEAEIRRLHAECSMAEAQIDSALAGFASAAARAAQQGARLWQLRIATSQSRALASRGDSLQAAELLRDALSHVDASLPDADVRTARSLLSGLGS